MFTENLLLLQKLMLRLAQAFFTKYKKPYMETTSVRVCFSPCDIVSTAETCRIFMKFVIGF